MQLDKKLYWFPWFKLCSLHLATSVIGLTPFIMFWYDCKLILQWLITEENVSPGFWEDWCNYCTVRLIVIMHRNITVSLLLLLITMGTLISDVLCDNRTQRFKRRVIFIKGSKFFVSVNNYFKNVVHFYVCVILKIKRKDLLIKNCKLLFYLKYKTELCKILHIVTQLNQSIEHRIHIGICFWKIIQNLWLRP